MKGRSNGTAVALTLLGHFSSCEIGIDEQSGFLVASVPAAGFLTSLSPDARVLFENALAGFYHLAGIDLVRELLLIVRGS